MTRALRVEPARAVDAAQLFSALAGLGLTGIRVDGLGRLTVPVDGEGAERVHADVARILEAWAAEHELPFVPTRIDEDSYALRPAAG